MSGADAIAARLADVLAGWARPGGPAPVVGLQGGQGSGKSTLAAALAVRLGARGVRVATLSLDDVYLPRAARAALAVAVHPLLATRGVPGTHDVALAHAALDRLVDPRGGDVALPVFDKGLDDRAATARWVRGPFDLVLFEGWCVGLPPVPAEVLARPVNALERDEDPDGRWRSYVADALAGPYAGLWARLDRLVVLQAPSWATITRWRQEPEAALRAVGAPRAMSEAATRRFLEHYERWARWGLEVLPARADVVVTLGEEREPLDVRGALRGPA